MDWLFAASALIIGVGIGFFIGRPDAEERERVRQTEEGLRQAREQLTEYRMQVTQHFSRSAELIDGMTSSYRAFYDHLVHSSERLCDEGDLRKLEEQVSRSQKTLPPKKPIDGKAETRPGQEKGGIETARDISEPQRTWSEILPESETSES